MTSRKPKNDAPTCKSTRILCLKRTSPTKSEWSEENPIWTTPWEFKIDTTSASLMTNSSSIRFHQLNTIPICYLVAPTYNPMCSMIMRTGSLVYMINRNLCPTWIKWTNSTKESIQIKSSHGIRSAHNTLAN